MSNVLDRILPFLNDVKNPAQYVGGEWNRVVKDPNDVRVRIGLAFPDSFEVGMSHLGLKILYGLMNSLDFVWAERVFAPWMDMCDELKQRDIPLFTLESHTPLSDLDVIGFSLQSELTYSNVLLVLDLGGVPLLAADRKEGDPIVIAGGSGAAHPETLAEFVDVFIQGDGEEALVLFVQTVDELRRAGLPRERILLEVARRHEFCYVPRFYEPSYEGGAFAGMKLLEEGLPHPVATAVVADLDNAYFPTRPVVPNARVAQDRIMLEIMRGCARGCRFCQAGMLKRPIRVRRPETLVRQALETYRNTGYDEVSLQSLSSGDYPAIHELITLCNEQLGPQRVGLALPSLRVTEQLSLLPGRIKNIRKSGLTMAPEVATDRLRRVINKEMLNRDIFATAAAAFENGWDLVKLYFMIGIPGETEEDIIAIWEMADEVSRLRRKATGKANAKVNVTISTFVPKPFTPFQWAPMLDLEEIRERQQLLLDQARNKRVRLKFHDPESSILEGVISRGDRRVGRAMLAAYKKGARFDAWNEGFHWQTWLDAFEETGVDPRQVANTPFDPALPLPWDHVAPGVSKEWLQEEHELAEQEKASGDCIGAKCNRCGVDMKLCASIKRE